MTMGDVETLGVDLRTRSRSWEHRASDKKKVQSEVLDDKKLLHAGMMPARTWRVHAVEMAPSERLKLRRQMAAAAGKKSTTLLSLFMETYGFEVDEELSTLVTQYWAAEVWTGKWSHELDEADSRGSNMETGDRTRRSSDV